MALWFSATVLILCAAGAIYFFHTGKRKEKKALFYIAGSLLAVLSGAMVLYLCAAAILLAGIDRKTPQPLPSEAEIVLWWGTYKSNEGKRLGITNYNGSSFLFSLTDEEGRTFDGAAPTEENRASYMDLHFLLEGDVLTITQEEGRADADARKSFTGKYRRAGETEEEKP